MTASLLCRKAVQTAYCRGRGSCCRTPPNPYRGFRVRSHFPETLAVRYPSCYCDCELIDDVCIAGRGATNSINSFKASRAYSALTEQS